MSLRRVDYVEYNAIGDSALVEAPLEVWAILRLPPHCRGMRPGPDSSFPWPVPSSRSRPAARLLRMRASVHLRVNAVLEHARRS